MCHSDSLPWEDLVSQLLPSLRDCLSDREPLGPGYGPPSTAHIQGLEGAGSWSSHFAQREELCGSCRLWNSAAGHLRLAFCLWPVLLPLLTSMAFTGGCFLDISQIHKIPSHHLPPTEHSLCARDF